MRDIGEPHNLMDEREVLIIRLTELRRRHRSLDDAIMALEGSVAGRESLDLRRLKKQKLSLKDEIARLEDRTIPDIIA